MPRSKTLAALFGHNDWARDKLMALAVVLDDEALDRHFEMGPGTLRKTLHHLWAGEQFWLTLWLEAQPNDPRLDQRYSVPELKDHFGQTARKRDELFAGLGSDGWARQHPDPVTEGRVKLTLGDMAVHVYNHGVHHRAQALNMLRCLGVKVPGLDYLYMLIERQAGAPSSRSEGGRQTMAPATEYDVELIQRYYRYGDCAHHLVHDLAAKFSDEQLDRPFDTGVGCLRKTLLHIHDAEQWWLENWSGNPAGKFAELPATTSLVEVRSLFDRIARRRNTILQEATPQVLAESVTASPSPERSYTFTKGDSMLQLCGHGTHHRAQALNMLRRLGVETPALDYTAWLRNIADA